MPFALVEPVEPVKPVEPVQKGKKLILCNNRLKGLNEFNELNEPNKLNDPNEPNGPNGLNGLNRPNGLTGSTGSTGPTGSTSPKGNPAQRIYLICFGLSSTTRKALPSLRAMNLCSTRSISTLMPMLPLICAAILPSTSCRRCSPAS